MARQREANAGPDESAGGLPAEAAAAYEAGEWARALTLYCRLYYDRVAPLWRTHAGDELRALHTLLLSGRRVIAAGGKDRALYLFDAQGGRLWRRAVGGELRGVCAADWGNPPQRYLVAGVWAGDPGQGRKDSGLVHVLRAQDGGPAHEAYALRSPVTSVARMRLRGRDHPEDAVVIGCLNGELWLLRGPNAPPESLIQHRPGQGAVLRRRLAVRQEPDESGFTLAFTGYDGDIDLHSCDARGMRRRSRTVPLGGGLLFDAVYDNFDNAVRPSLITVSNGGEVFVLDEEGRRRWSYRCDDHACSVAAGTIPGTENRKVLVGTRGDRVHVLGFRGVEEWSFRTPHQVWSMTLCPLDVPNDEGGLEEENVLIAGLGNGEVSAWRFVHRPRVHLKISRCIQRMLAERRRQRSDDAEEARALAYELSQSDDDSVCAFAVRLLVLDMTQSEPPDAERVSRFRARLSSMLMDTSSSRVRRAAVKGIVNLYKDPNLRELAIELIGRAARDADLLTRRELFDQFDQLSVDTRQDYVRDLVEAIDQAGSRVRTGVHDLADAQLAEHRYENALQSLVWLRNSGHDLLWRTELSAPPFGLTLLDDERAVVECRDGQLVELRLSDGRMRPAGRVPRTGRVLGVLPRSQTRGEPELLVGTVDRKIVRYVIPEHADPPHAEERHPYEASDMVVRALAVAPSPAVWPDLIYGMRNGGLGWMSLERGEIGRLPGPATEGYVHQLCILPTLRATGRDSGARGAAVLVARSFGHVALVDFGDLDHPRSTWEKRLPSAVETMAPLPNDVPDRPPEVLCGLRDGSVWLLRPGVPQSAPSAPLFRFHGFVRSVQVGELCGDGRLLYLLASRDGTVVLLEPSGKTLLRIRMDGPVRDAVAFGGPGPKRVLVAGDDSTLHCFQLVDRSQMDRRIEECEYEMQRRTDLPVLWQSLSADERLVLAACAAGWERYLERNATLVSLIGLERIIDARESLLQNAKRYVGVPAEPAGDPTRLTLEEDAAEWLRERHEWMRVVGEQLFSPEIYGRIELSNLRAVLSDLSRSAEVSLPIESSQLHRLSAFGLAWEEQGDPAPDPQLARPRIPVALIDAFLSFLSFRVVEELTGTRDQPARQQVYKVNVRALGLRVSDETLLFPVHSDHFDEHDLKALVGTVSTFHKEEDRSLLMVVGPRSNRVRDMVLAKSTDFIVIDEPSLRAVVFAPDPPRAFVERVLLRQLDLAAISPYTVSRPAQRIFFGRSDQIKKIVSGVDTNFSIYGARRIGKTSLMRRVQHILEERNDSTAVYLDCSPSESPNWLIGRLAEALELPSEPDSFDALAREIRRLVRESGRKLVVFLDEFDAILDADRQQDYPLTRQLHALSQERHCRFIVAGYRELYQESQRLESPFYNFFEPIKLGRIDRRSAAELVTVPMERMSVSYDDPERCVEMILEYTACHPNLIQLFCMVLVEDLADRIADERAGAVRSLGPEDIERVFETGDYVGEVVLRFIDIHESALERDLLRVLADWLEGQWERSITRETLCELARAVAPGAGDPAINRAIQHFLLNSVLRQRREGSQINYAFEFPLIPRLIVEGKY